ncbi:MAG: hypothetical protein G01um101472_156 [Parcubacteria group bacterium Gr01-1014_72]|jgi:hypothetical protein|nr:MAG: hypothetical protein G01um101472_156 [Parcubacteria group bacterium Gr01-1014_72]
MTHTNNRVHAAALGEKLSYITRALFGGVFLLIFLYVYAVNQAVINVAARGSAEERVRVLQSRVAALESEYLSRTRTITADFAIERGFVETPRLRYVSRLPLGLLLAKGSGI